MTCVTESKCICLIARKSYIWFIPAVLVTAGIAFLSLSESTRVPSVRLNDKLLHGLMYTALALTWLLPLIKSPITDNHSPITNYAVVLFGTTAYGALLEILQHYCTRTRSGDLLDLLADFLGALLGVSIIALIKWLNNSLTK